MSLKMSAETIPTAGARELSNPIFSDKSSQALREAHLESQRSEAIGSKSTAKQAAYFPGGQQDIVRSTQSEVAKALQAESAKPAIQLAQNAKPNPKINNNPPRGFWENLKSSFSSTSSGRFLIGVVTIAGKAVDAMFDDIEWKQIGSRIATGTKDFSRFITKAENWKAAYSHLKDTCSAIKVFFTSEENQEKFKAIWGKICTLGSKLGSKVWEEVSNLDNWKQWSLAALNIIKDPKNWVNLVKGLLAYQGTVLYAVVKAISLIPDFLTDPVKAFRKLCGDVDSFTKSLCDKLGIPGLHATGRSIVGFFAELSDSLGVSDILMGLGNMIALFPRAIISFWNSSKEVGLIFKQYVTGQISQEQFSKQISETFSNLKRGFVKDLKECSRLFTGIARLACEVTGIADLWRGCCCLVNGDLEGAGVHFGLFAVNLGIMALTAVSGGACAALYSGVGALRAFLKKGVLALGEKGLLAIGEELGEAVVKDSAKRLGTSTLRSQGTLLADSVIAVADKKGISLKTFESLVSSTNKKDLLKFWKKLDLDKIVFERSKTMLQACADDPKGLAKWLAFHHKIEEKQALKMARSAISMLESGFDLNRAAKALSGRVSSTIQRNVEGELKGSFLNRLRSSLMGEVDTPAAKRVAAKIEQEANLKGLSKSSLVDQYLVKAEKGFNRALKESLEEICEAAIKRAIRSLKFKRKFKLSSESSQQPNKQPNTKQVIDRPTLSQSEIFHREKDEQNKKTKVIINDERHGKIRRKTIRSNLQGQNISYLEEQTDYGEWKVVDSRQVGEEFDSASKKLGSDRAKAVNRVNR